MPSVKCGINKAFAKFYYGDVCPTTVTFSLPFREKERQDFDVMDANENFEGNESILGWFERPKYFYEHFIGLFCSCFSFLIFPLHGKEKTCLLKAIWIPWVIILQNSAFQFYLETIWLFLNEHLSMFETKYFI